MDRKRLLGTLKSLPMLHEDKEEFVDIIFDAIENISNNNTDINNSLIKYYKIDRDKCTELGYFTNGNFSTAFHDYMFNIFSMFVNRVNINGEGTNTLTVKGTNMPVAITLFLDLISTTVSFSIIEKEQTQIIQNGVTSTTTYDFAELCKQTEQAGIDISIFNEITKEEFMNPF